MVAPGDMHGCWGACMVAGGHAWLQGDACLQVEGDMHGGGCACMVVGGVCMVARGRMGVGGIRGCRGACVVAGACMVVGDVWLCGGRAWLGGMHRI